MFVVYLISDNEDHDTHWLSFFFFATLSVIYTIYAVSMRMRTAEGVKLAAELEGFRMYMKTAEEHRLNMLNPPERTPELFERLLPYAIAMGVSNDWCKKFGSVLELANYQPQWYSGDVAFSGAVMVATFTALGSSLSSTISSASIESSSGSSSWDSGSDDGGSSGGGGGGGGGGGW